MSSPVDVVKHPAKKGSMKKWYNIDRSAKGRMVTRQKKRRSGGGEKGRGREGGPTTHHPEDSEHCRQKNRWRGLGGKRKVKNYMKLGRGEARRKKRRSGNVGPIVQRVPDFPVLG